MTSFFVPNEIPPGMILPTTMFDNGKFKVMWSFSFSCTIMCEQILPTELGSILAPPDLPWQSLASILGLVEAKKEESVQAYKAQL